MSDQLNRAPELAISLPIPGSFRQQAKAYALQYFIPDVRKRVYLQTLGLLAVNGYLHLLGFPTNLSAPERWNAAYRVWSEVNELELPGYGYLQCCAITPGQETAILTSECSLSQVNSCINKSDCIGYVFVEIANGEKTATLIGFLPFSGADANLEIDTEIAIANLQPIDDLIDDLSGREASTAVNTNQFDDLTREFTKTKITYLRNWLNHIYEGEWQPSFRDLNTTTCKKKLQLAGRTLTIQLSVAAGSDRLTLVQVIVQAENTTLPQGLQVSVPDESEIYTETVNGVADMISIPLELSADEEFWVELRFQEQAIREYFIA
ncbi:MAG: DUF1822 family protein [Calothrix sp. C42_A2020_038]|nr:DUF1822 family protein [Calothrix sp. C42_A2020_038]